MSNTGSCYVGLFSRNEYNIKETFKWILVWNKTLLTEYMKVIVLRTTPWSKSSSVSFDVTLAVAMALFLSCSLLWKDDLLIPVGDTVLLHIQSSNSCFIPDSFCPTQNLYTNTQKYNCCVTWKSRQFYIYLWQKRFRSKKKMKKKKVLSDSNPRPRE